MRKYVKALLFVLTILVFAAIGFVWFAKSTVAWGEKNDTANTTVYGYRIEQYWYWNSMRLTIWTKRGLSYGMTSVYDLPDLTVDKALEERWLKNDSAIYLNIQFKRVDSLVTTASAKVLYDFHRGEMYTTSQHRLWRIWNKTNRSEDWMTEDEFDAVLNRLGP